VTEAADPCTPDERYLAAGLRWLRLRLARLAEVPLAEPRPPQKRGCLFFWRRPPAEPAPAPPRLVSEEEVREARAEMVDALQHEPRPAMAHLVHLFGLSHGERDTLLLCAGAELDPALPGLIAAAQGEGRRQPTFALALQLFEDWAVVAPERPLRALKMVEIDQPGGQPLTASPLRADERLVNYLKGVNVLDDRLGLMLTPVHGGEGELPHSQAHLVNEIIAAAGHHRDGRGALVQLLGDDAASKLLVAARAAAETGRELYRLGLDALPATLGAIEDLARLWRRESALLPLALYVDAHELDRAGERRVALERFLVRAHGGLMLLDVREPAGFPGRPALTVEVARPRPDEQRAEWCRVLGEGQEKYAELLAAQFNFNYATIRRIGEATEREVPGGLPHRFDRVWAACLAVVRPRLDAVAQRLPPAPHGVELVLPPSELALIDRIIEQVRYRGRVLDDWGFRRLLTRGQGLSVLFAGDSGTGKTLAAEVLAGRLHLNLYRIDLSTVVSKYIGETEKNLARLFDAAEDGGTLLFFDEADALFGRRTEVKDSHDRYANIETNYLLQRIESFRGLAILATNFKRALDPAFLRRLQFIVQFPFPAPKERERIWRQAFPVADPARRLRGVTVRLSDADYTRLSALALTGGSIRNVALSATFLAAAGKRTVVELRDVLAAARTEFTKLGQEIPPEAQDPPTPPLPGPSQHTPAPVPKAQPLKPGRHRP
jgi:hypothetical protein